MEVSKSIATKEVFTEWVHLYSDKLYSWALHKTSNKEVAEDLVQETFYSAYKSLEKFEGKSSPTTWLTKILNNKIVDYYRRSAKDFVLENTPQTKFAYDASEQVFTDQEEWADKENRTEWGNEKQLLDNEEFVATMEKCYEQLPPNWKNALQSKYILEVDSTIICQELDITPSNYWKVIQRSKLLLKKCLENNWFK